MSNVLNISDLTKKAIAQTMGGDYMEQKGQLASLNNGLLVDVGKDVASLQNGVDNFCKALIDVIGEIEYDNWVYEPEIKQLYKTNFEWGGFLERVKFAPNIVETDDLFNLVDQKDYSSYEHKAYIPNISVKIFAERKGITLPLTIKTSQIETAFTSMLEMEKFISSLRENMMQTRKMILDAYAHILVSSGIAISDKVTSTAIHLLTEAKANGILTESDTVETARQKTAFNNYCMKRIATVREYMKRHNLAFNNKSNIPPSGSSNLIVLNEFEKDCRFTSEAETYHNDKLSIGDYDVVSAWQAFVGTVNESPEQLTDYKFDTVSSVKVDDTSNKLGIGTEATISNCIAFAYDNKAIGINNERVKTTSSYTASADFWNEFVHIYMNYILDSDYSMVAFLLD